MDIAGRDGDSIAVIVTKETPRLAININTDWKTTFWHRVNRVHPADRNMNNSHTPEKENIFVFFVRSKLSDIAISGEHLNGSLLREQTTRECNITKLQLKPQLSVSSCQSASWPVECVIFKGCGAAWFGDHSCHFQGPKWKFFPIVWRDNEEKGRNFNFLKILHCYALSANLEERSWATQPC